MDPMEGFGGGGMGSGGGMQIDPEILMQMFGAQMGGMGGGMGGGRGGGGGFHTRRGPPQGFPGGF
jgi:DnaJ family protein C protein 7